MATIVILSGVLGREGSMHFLASCTGSFASLRMTIRVKLLPQCSAQQFFHLVLIYHCYF